VKKAAAAAPADASSADAPLTTNKADAAATATAAIPAAAKTATADAKGSDDGAPAVRKPPKVTSSGRDVGDDGLPLTDRYAAGKLEADVKASGAIICEAILQGPATDLVLSASQAKGKRVNPGNRPMLSAYLNCRGGGPLVIHGGPALAPFAANFTNVKYVKEVQLPGGSIEIRGQNVAFENSFFVNLNYMGRAALAFADARAAFINSTFVANNNAAAGCIYANESSVIRVLDSTFSNNGGGQAGAINVWNSSLIINGTTFLNNTSRGEGGAISAVNSPVIQVLNSTVLHNSAKNGGGVYLEDCGHASIYQSVFTGNLAKRAGGGLWQTKCSGDLTENTFRNNRGSNAGAVWQNACKKLVISDNKFVNNTADKGSAGIEMNQCNAGAKGRGDGGGDTGERGGGWSARARVVASPLLSHHNLTHTPPPFPLSLSLPLSPLHRHRLQPVLVRQVREGRRPVPAGRGGRHPRLGV